MATTSEPRAADSADVGECVAPLVEGFVAMVARGSRSQAETPAQNLLSSFGSSVAYAAKRAALLGVLESSGWSLKAVSDSLRMGGTSHVLRAIKDLGLIDELVKVRVAGIVRRGRRTRARKAVG